MGVGLQKEGEFCLVLEEGLSEVEVKVVLGFDCLGELGQGDYHLIGLLLLLIVGR